MRLAAVIRDLVVRTARCSACNLSIPPYKPDYADIRTEIEPWVELEEVKARLDEAKRAGNKPRIAELQGQLAAAYMRVSQAIDARKGAAKK